MERKVLIPETDGVHTPFTVSIFFPVKSHLEHSFGVLKYWFYLFSQNLTRVFSATKNLRNETFPLGSFLKAYVLTVIPLGRILMRG